MNQNIYGLLEVFWCFVSLVIIIKWITQYYLLDIPGDILEDYSSRKFLKNYLKSKKSTLFRDIYTVIIGHTLIWMISFLPVAHIKSFGKNNVISPYLFFGIVLIIGAIVLYLLIFSRIFRFTYKDIAVAIGKEDDESKILIEEINIAKKRLLRKVFAATTIIADDVPEVVKHSSSFSFEEMVSTVINMYVNLQLSFRQGDILTREDITEKKLQIYFGELTDDKLQDIAEIFTLRPTDINTINNISLGQELTFNANEGEGLLRVGIYERVYDKDSRFLILIYHEDDYDVIQQGEIDLVTSIGKSVDLALKNI